MSSLGGMSESNAGDDVKYPVVDVVKHPEAVAFKHPESLTRRETLVDTSTIFLWVLASDWLLYHSSGYAAWAVFVPLAAGVMFLGRRRLGAKFYTLTVTALMLACSLRLAWCGSVPAVWSAVALIVALSMCINGTPPYLPDMLRFGLHVLAGGGFRLSRFSLRGAGRTIASTKARFGILLPMIVVVAFSLIFVRANPDVYRWIDEQLRLSLDSVGRWLQDMDPFQVVFWIVSAWIAMGLCYPAAEYLWHSQASAIAQSSAPSDNYVAVRNTLISVVLLFAVYLVFEFATLWFREFPKGFYYAGYAHEGAFWLTVALALSTLVLSFAFTGTVVRDERVVGLKRWAWIWSLENFLLGMAVFHRLFIYIDFNGMTRMRVIGLLGTLAVIIGFALVVYKIARSRGFLWLVRHQLWTVAIVSVIYTILPVDYLVHRFNAAEILAGNPAPSTQIPTHETSAEGLIPLVSLLESSDENIRSGIAATLADWLIKTPVVQDWRDNQWAHQYLREKLAQHLTQLRPYLDSKIHRETTMTSFYNYAYQWY